MLSTMRIRRLLTLLFVVIYFSTLAFLFAYNKLNLDTDKCAVFEPDVSSQSVDRLKDDSDRDGIKDVVEIAHDAKIFGTNSLNWPDPYHADLYLELDTQEGYLVPAEVKKGAVDFYANLDFCNPDGTKGIRLHIDDASLEFYFGGGQVFEDESQEMYPQLTMMAMHEDEEFFSPDRCGIFRYGLVLKNLGWLASKNEAAGLGDAPGDTLYLAGESLIRNHEFSIVVITHELGHNILGQLDEKNWNNEDTAHDPYGDFMSYRSFGSNLWAHSNVVAELTRDGLLGLSGKCR